MPHRLTELSLARPRTVLVLLAIATLGLGAGVTRVRTEFGYRVLLGSRHPSIQALDGLIRRFGGGLPLHVAWGCGDGAPCGAALDPRSLAMAHSVTQELLSRDGVQSVQGPANAALLVPDARGFAVRRLVEGGEPAADLPALAARALADPLWVGTLVSADGAVGSLVVQPVDTRNETNVRVVDAVAEALAPFEARGFAYHLVGDPVGTVLVGRDLAESTARLTPLTVLVIGAVLLTLTRSLAATVAVLGSMGVAILWTLGLLGWLGWPRDGVLEVLTPLLLVVGVCESVHLIARYEAELGAAGSDRRGAMLRAARDVGPPCLFTTLTTCAGFFSFTTSALDTFVRFGLISTFGVAACLALSFTLLPLAVCALPAGGARVREATRSWGSVLDAVVRTSERRAVPILVATALLFALGALGWAAHLRVDTDWYESFGARSQVMRWVRFLEDHLGPSGSLEVEVALPEGAALEDPGTLHALAALSQALSRIDGLGPARSVVDLVGRVNRLLHDDDPAREGPAGSRAANAEILELLSLDDPGVLAPWASLDRSRVRLSVEAPEQSYASVRRVLETARERAAAILPKDFGVTLSGELAIQFDWIHDVQGTQLRSFPTALALVYAMVAFFLRSARLALAAMVPTLLPVVTVLGAMGWAGMSLDVGRAMIAAVVIGLAVDESIHVLDHYRRERAAGVGPQPAIRTALRHTARAAVTTSIALTLGFLTLLASSWQTISSFGFFVSLAILGALAAALFVLPALLFVFARPAETRRRARPRPA